ncbi:MAG: FMN-binding protein [Alphaproteobacteria bacterium]|nr:FMN-binding protein [Alphaproteobacteria bacterium]
MRLISKFATLLFSSAALISHASAATVPAVTDPQATPDLTAQAAALHDGTFIGGSYDAYYGMVQVQATIKKGSIVNVKALKFPNHSGTSRAINRQALPYLLQEVVSAQNAKVQIIGGATLTSRAYIRSLRDALVLSSK